MKGLIELATIVGCDILLEDGKCCPRLLVFNRAVTSNVDDEISRRGWAAIARPAGDSELQQEHACPVHTEELGLLRAVTTDEADLHTPEYIETLTRALQALVRSTDGEWIES